MLKKTRSEAPSLIIVLLLVVMLPQILVACKPFYSDNGLHATDGTLPVEVHEQPEFGVVQASVESADMEVCKLYAERVADLQNRLGTVTGIVAATLKDELLRFFDGDIPSDWEHRITGVLGPTVPEDNGVIDAFWSVLYVQSGVISPDNGTIDVLWGYIVDDGKIAVLTFAEWDTVTGKFKNLQRLFNSDTDDVLEQIFMQSEFG